MGGGNKPPYRKLLGTIRIKQLRHHDTDFIMLLKILYRRVQCAFMQHYIRINYGKIVAFGCHCPYVIIVPEASQTVIDYDAHLWKLLLKVFHATVSRAIIDVHGLEVHRWPSIAI